MATSIHTADVSSFVVLAGTDQIGLTILGVSFP